MKRGFIVFIFIITLGMTSSLLAAQPAPGHSQTGGYYGSFHSPYASVYEGYGSRYNPYTYNPIYPLQNQTIQDPTQQRSAYEWYDVTSYPRWYESPENYQKIYGKFGEEPKTLTPPYREVKKPYSSGVLTSPYEDY